jgi:hypothetical protein
MNGTFLNSIDSNISIRFSHFLKNIGGYFGGVIFFRIKNFFNSYLIIHNSNFIDNLGYFGDDIYIKSKRLTIKKC